jgi:hypothetical protein
VAAYFGDFDRLFRPEPPDPAALWRAHVHRFDVEHTLHFVKERLGWHHNASTDEPPGHPGCLHNCAWRGG